MGRRGPKGKSPELESAQGFPGRRKKKTAAALAAKTRAAEPVQPKPADSPFVPPAPRHIPKRAREIWAERFADPATHLIFKRSDHRVVERYCFLLAEIERFTKKPPKPSYETFATNGERAIKRNPDYDMMLAAMREVRAIEQVIGANPTSRLGLEGKLAAPPPDGPDAGALATPPARTGAARGPLGVLKSRETMN